MRAVVAALFPSHEDAEGVRTRLVADGFPTDRVDLTSRETRTEPAPERGRRLP